ncbi:hypothetical protein [Dyella sp. ASV21]|uniref:hypothetical protein n=1 Tax=Dyella sp. ASV21 TaxID=2795114 RepID=UPI0018EAC502|nr:hypothetical protein [Dyella sp. ASV21]
MNTPTVGDTVSLRRADVEKLIRFAMNHAGNGVNSSAKDAAIRLHDRISNQPEGSNNTPEGMVSLPLGHSFLVHGSVDAIIHAQSCLLIDSTHPVESQDNARYFQRLAAQKQAEADKLAIALLRTRNALRTTLGRLESIDTL